MALVLVDTKSKAVCEEKNKTFCQNTVHDPFLYRLLTLQDQASL